MNILIPTGYTTQLERKDWVAQAVQRTEPRSVTLAELPAHLWAKPALWARTYLTSLCDLLPCLQGRRARLYTCTGRSNLSYFFESSKSSNNKLKLNGACRPELGLQS